MVSVDFYSVHSCLTRLPIVKSQTKTGVLELAGKGLDEKTLVLPCWLNGVRE